MFDLSETSEVILTSIKEKKNIQNSRIASEEAAKAQQENIHMFTDVGQMFVGQVQFKYILFDGEGF